MVIAYSGHLQRMRASLLFLFISTSFLHAGESVLLEVEAFLNEVVNTSELESLSEYYVDGLPDNQVFGSKELFNAIDERFKAEARKFLYKVEVKSCTILSDSQLIGVVCQIEKFSTDSPQLRERIVKFYELVSDDASGYKITKPPVNYKLSVLAEFLGGGARHKDIGN